MFLAFWIWQRVWPVLVGMVPTSKVAKVGADQLKGIGKLSISGCINLTWILKQPPCPNQRTHLP
jgi:hypothetical protein